MNHLLEHLTEPQREAVSHCDGPLLVLAGPGSGKTRVITHRIAYMLESGVPASQILALTFTNKAADEMQRRVAELAPGYRVWLSTFHRFGAMLLRRYAEVVGLQPNFTIYDTSDARQTIKRVIEARDINVLNYSPDRIAEAISAAKNKLITAEQYEPASGSMLSRVVAQVYPAYQARLLASSAVDFDDLLLHTEELLSKFPDVREAEAKRFDQILVDEYQDTNRSQYAIVKALAGGHRNLCVVGDDDQSIYGWRGAEVTHILRFKHDWPEAKIVRLEDNYRSSAAILHYANTLIAFNQDRHEKTLRPAKEGGTRPVILQCKDEMEEAQKVIGDIQHQIAEGQAQPRDYAILCRTNEQPRSFETELRRANVPYVLIGGMSFFDRREVRDILAYLKIIDNPRDEPSLRRIINQPPRGIGDAAQKRLLDEAVAHGQLLWEALPNALAVDGIDAKTADNVKRFRYMIEEFAAQQEELGIAKFIQHVINKTGYRESLAVTYPDATERETRIASLEEIINAAASYENHRRAKSSPSLSGFLDDIMLNEREDSDEKDSQLSRNAVALMTLHSAKGLEFPRVYLVGMEEGILPHKRSVSSETEAAIDEERRLCYVGVTRAQDQLTLSFALTRRKWGKPRKTTPSRFLYEMTGQANNPRSPSAEQKPTLKKPARGRTSRSSRPSARR